MKYVRIGLLLLVIMGVAMPITASNMAQDELSTCVDFSGFRVGQTFSPTFALGGLSFKSLSGSSLNIVAVDGETGLGFENPGLSIITPIPASKVNLWVGSWAADLEIIAFNSVGDVVDGIGLPGDNQVNDVWLSGDDIVRIEIIGGDNEALLVRACVDVEFPPSTCIGFESLNVGDTFHVGDAFDDAGVTMAVDSFQWSNGQSTSNGYAEVQNGGLAGGMSNELQVNNVNIVFKLGSPVHLMTLRFGEYGGNLNITINGDFHNFNDFSDINGAFIGGTQVMAINGFGNDTGALILSGGPITDFVIGGQELWIDDVCICGERY